MSFAAVAASRPSLSHPAPLPLVSSWTFWHLIRHGRGSVQAANYEHALRPIATVSTAEEFWSVYGHLKRPSNLPVNSDYQVFRTGVKPVWEDEANTLGGKWMIRLRKGLANRLWEHLLLALLAGLFDDYGVCGAVLSVRYAEDIVSIWNGSASNEESKNNLRDRLKSILHLPPNIALEYKAHDTAMKDSSSFRNTDKFRP